nr:MAG TPA: hypothetical protein [Caudoviricetes sp.]
MFYLKISHNYHLNYFIMRFLFCQIVIDMASFFCYNINRK